MANITIVFMGFISQLITGGHHPVGIPLHGPYHHIDGRQGTGNEGPI